MTEAAAYWDFIEGVETPEQYDAFASFRDMGPRRTVRAVALLHQRSEAWCHAAAQQCSWHDRVHDFDVEQQRVRDAMLTERRTAVNAAWAERRAVLFDAVEDVAALGVEQLLFNLRTKRAALRPNELRLIIETLTKWQNLANGDATEKVDFGLDYSKLTDEEIAKLEEAARLQELAKIKT
jgi:hypothetical protein